MSGEKVQDNLSGKTPFGSKKAIIAFVIWPGKKHIKSYNDYPWD